MCLFRCFVNVQIMIVLAFMTMACSFSESSKSSSNSSRSISNSLSTVISSPSKSSGSSDEEETYQQEVLDYTYAYVKSSHADYQSFQKGLSEVAARQGVANWDKNPDTYIAIGRALKKAGIVGAAYETYQRNLAGGNYAKMADIQKGYTLK